MDPNNPEPLYVPPALEPDVVPPSPPIPADDPIVAARLAEARAQAQAEAYREFFSRQQQPVAPPPPQDPLDALSQSDRDQLNAMFLADPIGAAKKFAQLQAAHQEKVFEQRAQPFVRSQGALFVEQFKTRMAAQDPWYKDVVVGFSENMKSYNLAAIAQANEGEREQAFFMAWNAAKGVALERRLQASKPKSEPTLTAPGSTGGNPPTPSAQPAQELDPFMTLMKSRYKYTDEQLKHIQESA